LLCQAFRVTEELVYEDPTEAAGVNVHEMVVSVYGDTRPFHTGISLMLTPYLKMLSADPAYFRIIKQFGLEGTFKGHLVQPHCSEQGHLQTDQVAQSPV